MAATLDSAVSAVPGPERARADLPLRCRRFCRSAERKRRLWRP